MPIYEYKCLKCQHIFEELVFSSLASDEEIECPNCGERSAQKKMSAFSSSSSGGYTSAGAASCGSSGFS